MSDTIWFLKRCPLFEGLTPAQRRRLESRAVLRTFRRGEVIYFPTDPGRCVLLLARGRVKIKAVTPEGKETILAFIDEGELFGELALLDDEPRNEFAEAVSEVRLVAFLREDLLWLMEQRPDVALSLTKLVGLRRRRIENRLRNILFRPTRERLLSLLQELLESHGRPAGGAWEIGLRLSHQELASLIGATRETVTLTLGQFQREGLIRVDRRRITVVNRKRLGAEAAGLGPPDSGPQSPVPRPKAPRCRGRQP
jgi:CRP/FNR family transcriptional regulator, cyclic AMP receptor protein